MRTFKDARGREWTIEITIGLRDRVKERAGIDLLQPEDKNMLARLFVDDAMFLEVIFETIRPQMERDKLSRQDVADALDGAAWAAACDAWVEDYKGFCLSRRRKDLAAALTRMGEGLAIATEAAQKRIGEIDLEARIEASIDGAKSGG